MKKSSLHITAELKNLANIRSFIRDTAASLGFDDAIIPDVVLAVDEAASNIVLHGYKGQKGIIEVEVEREGDALVVRLRDEAVPFDPSTIPPPDLTLPLGQRPVGGLGIYLTRQVMDEVTHRVTPKGGNELTLIKSGRPPDDEGSVAA